MSGSRKPDGLKLSEIASLIGLAVFIVAMVTGGAIWAWPQIQANWFPEPTPVVDVRPLIMSNAEMNGCLEPAFRTIVPGPYDPNAVIPAVTALQKSGVIGEVEGLLRRIQENEAAPYWTWSQEQGMELAILDVPGAVVYRLSLYCVTVSQEQGTTFPLYDTVIVEPAILEAETLD